MNKPDRSLRYAALLFVGLCIYSYLNKNQYKILPENYTDQDAVIAGVAYPFTFVFNFILSIGFFILLRASRLCIHLIKLASKRKS
jgi:hypothetical protein